MTDTPKQAEQQEQRTKLFLVDRSGRIMSANGLSLVQAKADSTAVRTAMSDPSRVLRVEAYPGVVEALAEMVEYEELRCGKRGQVTPLPRCVYNARNRLAAVHPQGDKP